MKNALKSVIKNKLFLAVVINTGFLALCNFLFGLNYEMLDETIFAELAADNYYYLGNFSNYFLFAAVGTVQKIIYPVNAYVVIALILGLLSMITVSYIILDRFRLPYAAAVIILLNGFFGLNHYATVSFTRLPAVLCVSGLLCILHSAGKKRFIYGFLWGAFLVAAGSMYRFKVFAVCTGIFIAFICILALSDGIKAENGFSLKRLFAELFEPKRLVCGIVLIALCFGISALGNSTNKNGEGIEYYTEYTAARSAVWDYEIPAYNECRADYEAIGIDENDLKMLEGHYLDDEGAFTLEKLNAINEIKVNHNAERSVLGLIKATVKEELFEITHLTFKAILYLSVIIITCIFLLLMKGKYCIVPISLYGVAGILYVYLYYFGRVPYRAVYGIWLSIAVYLIYALDSVRIRDKVKTLLKPIKSKRFAAALLACSVAVSGGFLFANNYRNFKNDFKQMKSERAGINAYIKAHPDDRFELCRQANLLEGNLDNGTIYTINNEGRRKNSHIFNGTYYALPYYDEFNRDVFGTDNLYSNLFNENVYYVDFEGRFKDVFKKYLQKYYSDGKTVSYTVTDTVDGFEIVSYSLE